MKNSPRSAALAASIALVLHCEAPAAATIAVDGNCALADAVASANTDAAIGGCSAGAGADLILLPAEGQFPASGSAMPITSDLTIRGLGASSNVNCESGSRAFVIGGVDESGELAPTVRLEHFSISSCRGRGGAGSNGGGGGAGMGGAVFVYDGVVAIDQMTFSFNSAVGGAGGSGSGGGRGGGGGMGGDGGGNASSTGGDSADTGFGSGGGGGAAHSSGAPLAGGSAGAPHGGTGGDGGIFAVQPSKGGFGGGGGGGASINASANGQDGASGGFGGGGGGGGSSGISGPEFAGGRGGDGGFGAGGGAGGNSSTQPAGSGGHGGFGGGGGVRGSQEGGGAVNGLSGFGASAPAADGGTGAAFGGAIAVRGGSVLIENSQFVSNSATTSPSAQALGGAIFVLDDAAISAHIGSGAGLNGLPTEAPTVSGCSLGFVASTAASSVGSDNNNADVYGVSRSELQSPCKNIFMDGFE